MVCYDVNHLKEMFEVPSRDIIMREILGEGPFDIGDLRDKAKMDEIAKRHKIVVDKEDTEIFSAAYVFLKFFPKDSQLCYYLDNKVNVKVNPLNTIANLKSSIKENDINDFFILSPDGLRAFQIKAYTGESGVEFLFIFIKEKLLHYGNDLGKTNLLIRLQSKGEISGNYFHDLHSSLKTINLKGEGEISILYNEENKFMVLNTVYPILATKRIPHVPFSTVL